MAALSGFVGTEKAVEGAALLPTVTAPADPDSRWQAAELHANLGDGLLTANAKLNWHPAKSCTGLQLRESFHSIEDSSWMG